MQDGVARGYVLLERGTGKLPFDRTTLAGVVTDADKTLADKLIRDVAVARDDIAVLSKTREALVTGIGSLRDEIAALAKERDVTAGSLTDVRGELDALAKSRETLAGQIETARKDLQSADESRKTHARVRCATPSRSMWCSATTGRRHRQACRRRYHDGGRHRPHDSGGDETAGARRHPDRGRADGAEKQGRRVPEARIGGTMAQRTRIRRKARRGRPQVRRAPPAATTAMRAEAKQSMTAAGGLMIGGVQDPAEKAADRMADRVMRMGAPVIHRKCAECEAEEKEAKRAAKEPEEDKQVQAKAAPKTAPVAPGAAAAPASAGCGQGDRCARWRAAAGIGRARLF